MVELLHRVKLHLSQSLGALAHGYLHFGGVHVVHQFQVHFLVLKQLLALINLLAAKQRTVDLLLVLVGVLNGV